jgi:dTDP-4-amino-4,6-dideoxygalactose transaminase
VIGVHLGGIHFNNKVYSLCKKFKVPLITDSAQYHSATSGDYICYSFQAIKHITTADGGMLILNNKKEYERAKELRWFGIPRKFKKSWKKRGVTTDIKEAGYKYQPTDIDACFALAALPDLDKIIAYRKQLALEYSRRLKTVKEIQIVAGGTFWLFTILAKKRNKLADYLTKKGIETNLVHVRNDNYKIFSNKRKHLPNMNWVESRYLCLPLNNKVKRSDVKYICQAIKDYYDQS